MANFKMTKMILSLFTLAFLLFSGASFGAALSIKEISGEDLGGRGQQTVDLKASGKKATAIVFMSAKCPCSDSHVGTLKKLASDYPDFQFLAIHSNSDETIEESRSYFKKAGLPFPAIQDAKGKYAESLKALKTPHVFLVGSDGQILYQGGVTSSAKADTADKIFLKDAFEDLRAGRSVKQKEGRTLGCYITREGDLEKKAN